MSDADLNDATIAELAPRLASGALSPVELTRACLDRIAALDGSINAFIAVLDESALAEARQAEQDIRGGHYRGPLHGIPIAHKDLFYTRGVRTTAGSKILADFVPDFDAARCRPAAYGGHGASGKLNMHELAAGGTSDNPHYGAVHNPWDVRCHPGGLSGGSAAALAAGMCCATTWQRHRRFDPHPVSPRVGPQASEPTYGRVSCYGVVPLSWSLDHVGPMTRSVRDAALMLNVMAVDDPRDAASVDQPLAEYTADLDLGLRGLRVGIPTSYFSELLQVDVERAWRTAIDVLVGLSAEPVEVSVHRAGQVAGVGPPIPRAEMATYHEAWFEAHPDAYGPSMHQRMAIGRDLSAIDLVKGATPARGHPRRVVGGV